MDGTWDNWYNRGPAARKESYFIREYLPPVLQIMYTVAENGHCWNIAIACCMTMKLELLYGKETYLDPRANNHLDIFLGDMFHGWSGGARRRSIQAYCKSIPFFDTAQTYKEI
jgi:hypothetical protein